MQKSRKILIISVSALLAFLLVINPVASVIIYEAIFSVRYEPAPDQTFPVEHFEDLSVQSVELSGAGERLAGFKYFDPNVTDPKGLVVLAHGLGGGGHTVYMPLIDSFTDLGYYVFTYDATGNGESDGRDTNGLPQGQIDLDRAIDTALADPDYAGLPLFLVGHSWGAYSVGIVLGHRPEVKGAVMFAGFDSSTDMMQTRAADYVGSFLASLAMPTVSLYEWLKFGDRATLTVSDSISATDAQIMVVHSIDEATVPAGAGYNVYYEKHKDDPDVTFVLYEDRGHNNLYYLDDSAIDADLMDRIDDMFEKAK